MSCDADRRDRQLAIAEQLVDDFADALELELARLGLELQELDVT
jgi:hypothetical protein